MLASSHRNNGDIIAASDADDGSGRNCRRLATGCLAERLPSSLARRLAGIARAGTVRRWKRETSPPVVKVVLLSMGRLADREQHLPLLRRVGAVGTLTSPAATARSRSDVLSAIERSDSDSVPRLCATAIFSAIFGVTSSVTFDEGLDDGLAVVVLVGEPLVGGEHADVADDRLGNLERRTVAAARDLLGQHHVDVVAREDEAGDAASAFTGTVMARMPGPSAAARKPRSSGRRGRRG